MSAAASASASDSSCSDSDATDVGWLYCFENLCMPNIYKIGCSVRPPAELLMEINASLTASGPPTSYKIFLTRKVTRLKEIDRAVERLLDEVHKKLYTSEGFYMVSPAAVESLFTLVGPSDVGGEDDAIALVEEDVDDIDEMDCVCCDWKGQKYQYPHHVISNHLAQIKKLRSAMGYCAVFNIKQIKCRMCLTCNKGVAFTTVGTQEKIWYTLHSFRSKCQEKHMFEFERLQRLWESATASV